MDKKTEAIIDLLLNGNNVFLFGMGGAGKTYCARAIADYFDEYGWKVARTGSTGMAALNLRVNKQTDVGGKSTNETDKDKPIEVPDGDGTKSPKSLGVSTLHRWAGIGLARGSAETLLEGVKSCSRYRFNWTLTDLLIIDEISMIGGELWEKLDYIGRHMREEPEIAFGDLRIMIIGDFMQLPPVKDKWVFLTESWIDTDFKTFVFNEPMRYPDMKWYEMLKRIRIGKQTVQDMRELRTRKDAYKKLKNELTEIDVKPTILYSKKVNVSEHNKVELDKLQHEKYTFNAEDNFIPVKSDRPNVDMEHYKTMINDCIPEIIELKIGAQVMLKHNLSPDEGLVNGSRGVVTDIRKLSDGQTEVMVKFLNGIEMEIKAHQWDYVNEQGRITRSQIPLILAWSLTIHKVQGCTLDYVVVDLGPSVFAYGQAYVALSRARSLEGLFLSELFNCSIKCDKIALRYTQYLEQNGIKLD